MFESLSERLANTFDKLTGRGALSEGDVKTAMRQDQPERSGASTDKLIAIKISPSGVIGGCIVGI